MWDIVLEYMERKLELGGDRWGQCGNLVLGKLPGSIMVTLEDSK